MRFLAVIGFSLFYFMSVGQILTYKEEIKIFRSKNWAGLIADPRTTLKIQDSVYLNYFSIKESNKVFCDVEILKDQPPLEMPTYSGQIKTFKRYAALNFTWKNKKVKLYAYQNPQLTSPLYKNHLFIPLKDQSTGHQTYEGGRYLDVQSKTIQNGKLLLDLNQLYNPWCAYSDGYNCPIPPKENHLLVKVKAGEKNFKKEH